MHPFCCKNFGLNHREPEIQGRKMDHLLGYKTEGKEDTKERHIFLRYRHEGKCLSFKHKYFPLTKHTRHILTDTHYFFSQCSTPNYSSRVSAEAVTVEGILTGDALLLV